MANPDIDARISASQGFANFTTDGVDVAIRNGRAPFPGLFSQHLFDVRMLPVLSPRLLQDGARLASPQDLRRLPLIHDDSLRALANWPAWADWFEAAGVDGVDVSRGLRFSSADHAMEATIEGAGVLLAHKPLAFDDLRTGRLIAPFPLELAPDRAFYVVCPSGHEHRPKVAAFRKWILDEIERLPNGA